MSCYAFYGSLAYLVVQSWRIQINLSYLSCKEHSLVKVHSSCMHCTTLLELMIVEFRFTPVTLLPGHRRLKYKNSQCNYLLGLKFTVLHNLAGAVV